MDDKKLWEILGTSEDIELSANFRMNFWDRVESLKRKRLIIVRRFVPALATLTILLISIFVHLPRSPQYLEIPLISQKTIENFTTEELLVETMNYSNLETIMAETLSSEEILTAFVPEEILEEIEEKGGEKYNEI